MNTCPGCGEPMRVVPAGVSKITGKPYESFEACSAKCGFKVSQKPGYKSVVVESQRPTHVIPPNGNDIREKTMIMAYAKDVVVAKITVGLNEPGDSGTQIITLYRELMAELTNPLKGV